MDLPTFEKKMREVRNFGTREYITAGFTFLPETCPLIDAGERGRLNRATAAQVVRHISRENSLEDAARSAFTRRLRRAAVEGPLVTGTYSDPCPAIVYRKRVSGAPTKSETKGTSTKSEAKGAPNLKEKKEDADVLDLHTEETIDDLFPEPPKAPEVPSTPRAPRATGEPGAAGAPSASAASKVG